MNGKRRLLLLLVLVMGMEMVLMGQPAEARRHRKFSGGDLDFPATSLIQNCPGRTEFEFVIGNDEVREFFAPDLEVSAPFGSVQNSNVLPEKIDIMAKGSILQTPLFEEVFAVTRHDPVLLEVADGPVDTPYNGQLYEIRYSASSGSIPESISEPIAINWSVGNLEFNEGNRLKIAFFAMIDDEEILIDENDELAFTTNCIPQEVPTCRNEQIIIQGKSLSEDDWKIPVARAANIGGPVDQAQPFEIGLVNGATPAHRHIDVIGRVSEVSDTFGFDTNPRTGRVPEVGIETTDGTFSELLHSPYGYIKSIEISEPTEANIDVTYVNDSIYSTGQFRPQAVVAYDTYPTDQSNVSHIEFFNHYVGSASYSINRHHTTYSEAFNIPSIQANTDMTVTVIYIDNQNVDKSITVTASAGGISDTQTSFIPNLGEYLNIVDLYLENVPIGTNRIDFAIESPETTGDSAYLTGIVISYPCLAPNTNPIAANDTATTEENTTLTGNVLANDSDPDGDTLTVNTTPVAQPLNGTVALSTDGTYSYQPNVGFVGNDSFTYDISDGNGGTATATVSILVTTAPVTITPTPTPITPSSTPITPSTTPVPLTATSVPPTDMPTPFPPTATPFPPTATPVPPTSTPVPLAITPTNSPTPFFINPAPQSSGSMSGISTRGVVGTGGDVMIGGIIVENSPVQVIVRAKGPSMALPPFNVPGTLSNPVVELFSGASVIANNDNWQTGGCLSASGAQQPTDANESCLLLTLNPGAYTAIVSGSGGSTGVGLVEVYQADGSTLGTLSGISTRGKIGTGGDVLIGGIIVENQPMQVIVRAKGPSLGEAPFNVPGVLQDPQLELYNGATLIASNDDWRSGNCISAPSHHQPVNVRESCLIMTLNPGAYTAMVRGLGGSTGVGLVEVYNYQ